MTFQNVDETEETEKEALSLKDQIDSLQVTTREEYEIAFELNKKAREKKENFHKWFDPIDEQSKKTRQTTIAQRKKIDDPLDFIIEKSGSMMAVFNREEKRKIEAENARLRAEALKKAEEGRLAKAQELQDDGLTEIAISVLDQPIVTEKIEIQKFEKVGKEYYREILSAEVVDFMTLVKAVSDGKVPSQALLPDQKWLNARARSNDPVPGVRFVSSISQGMRK